MKKKIIEQRDYTLPTDDFIKQRFWQTKQLDRIEYHLLTRSVEEDRFKFSSVINFVGAMIYLLGFVSLFTLILLKLYPDMPLKAVLNILDIGKFLLNWGTIISTIIAFVSLWKSQKKIRELNNRFFKIR